MENMLGNTFGTYWEHDENPLGNLEGNMVGTHWKPNLKPDCKLFLAQVFQSFVSSLCTWLCDYFLMQSKCFPKKLHAWRLYV